jgi:acylphosphatase
MKTRVHLFISGTVRVFFRIGRNRSPNPWITGYVRNLQDGRVELVAEGEKDSVDTLVSGAIRDLSGYSRLNNVWHYKGGLIC